MWDRVSYDVWREMRRRCENPACKDFKNYGARGITVCERWNTLTNFVTDMGQRPSPRHTLERIDNDRGYEPGNVRWATRAEQAANRRGPRSTKPLRTVACRKCGQLYEGRVRQYCRGCNAAYMREWHRRKRAVPLQLGEALQA